MEPRPEFIERLLADIDAIATPPGAAPDQADRGVLAMTDPDAPHPERAYLVVQENHRVLAFARPSTRRRLVIGALAAGAAAIVVTVVLVVARSSTHHQPTPLAPAHLPAPNVQPQLYWRDSGGIGRANLDGTDVVRQLIPMSVALNCGVTVDRNYVYWPTGDPSQGAVARAKRDGTSVDTSFIVTGPYLAPCVAVDGAHIYWGTSNGTRGSIGRANLDGTRVQESFISVPIGNCGLAVDSAHIYWTSPSTGTIGRAKLDGTGVNEDFINGLGSAPPPGPSLCGVVVDGAHIYWGAANGAIGRANLDGTGVNESFISGPGLVGTFPVPCADDSTHLYWETLPSGPPRPRSTSIGRARLNGTDVQADFITGLDQPSGCAVGP